VRVAKSVQRRICQAWPQAFLFLYQHKRNTMNRLSILSIMGILLTSLFLPLTSPANAYHSRHFRSHFAGYDNRLGRVLTHRVPEECRFTNDGRRVCRGVVARPELDPGGNQTFAMADAGAVIGSRPSGCPHSYCGCGLRRYLGLGDERLNLASNWARLLPRESGPRPGVAAVRNHHVMYIESAAGNGQWLVRDYNSGGGLSRMHVRDVRGYVFVNPHGQVAGHGQVASRMGGGGTSSHAAY